MLARRKHFRGTYDELLKAKEVVNVCELPAFDVEHPTAADPALRKNHSLGGCSFGTDDLCRNRMAFVFDVDEPVLIEAAHAVSKHLGCAADEYRSSRSVGVHSFRHAIVHR